MQRGCETVFLTKSDQGGTESAKDDVFIAPMMNVYMQTEKKAYLKKENGGSDWVMCAYPADITAAMDERLRGIQVGDALRIGATGAGGYSDYLTVIEIVTIDELHNMDATEAFLTSNSGKSASNPTTAGVASHHTTRLDDVTEASDGTFSETGSDNRIVWATSSGFFPSARLAFKLNHTIVAYDLPGTVVTSELTTRTAATRLTARMSYSSQLSAEEHLFYPCYKRRTVSLPSEMQLTMPGHVGLIRGITLLGYSLVHGTNAGSHQQHAFREHDWYAINVSNVTGQVISNNSKADGAFYVVSAGDTVHSHVGTTEIMQYEPAGLVTVHFSPRNMPLLSVTLTDRDGNPAKFSRMHVWLKLHCA